MLCAGCYNAAPPSDEWLQENFRAHRADFDSVVTIVGSAVADDFVRYPPITCIHRAVDDLLIFFVWK